MPKARPGGKRPTKSGRKEKKGKKKIDYDKCRKVRISRNLAYCVETGDVIHYNKYRKGWTEEEMLGIVSIIMAVLVCILIAYSMRYIASLESTTAIGMIILSVVVLFLSCGSCLSSGTSLISVSYLNIALNNIGSVIG